MGSCCQICIHAFEKLWITIIFQILHLWVSIPLRWEKKMHEITISHFPKFLFSQCIQHSYSGKCEIAISRSTVKYYSINTHFPRISHFFQFFKRNSIKIKLKSYLSKLLLDILLLSLKMSEKRTFEISFQREVLKCINEGHTVYPACKFNSQRDKFVYKEGNFYYWNRNQGKIWYGGSKRPLMDELKDILAHEIAEMTLNKLKFTRRSHIMISNSWSTWDSNEFWASWFIG